MYTFTGQEYDGEFGLYNFNARLYDPVTCRFISADTVVPDWSNPQTLNRYAYCINNPLIYTDPSGHFFGIDDVVRAVVGAAIGGVTAALNGDDIGQGMMMGAVSGLLFSFAGDVIQSASVYDDYAGALIEGMGSLGQAGVYAGAGAVSGGINAAIAGGDIGTGILAGAAFGGVSSYMGVPNYRPFGDSAAGSMGNRIVNSSIAGAGFGATYAGATGRDVLHGAIAGARSGAFGSAANQLIGHTIGWALSDTGRPFSHDKESGFFIYKANVRPFTIGGVVLGRPDANWGGLYSKNTPYGIIWDHETNCHGPQQTVLGIGYAPVHYMSQALSLVISGFTNTHKYNVFENGWDSGYPSY